LGKWKNQLAGGNHQTFPGKGYMAPEKEELQRLRMEHEILQKSRGLLCERVHVIYDFIRQQHKVYPNEL
jgi:hypothetical protein